MKKIVSILGALGITSTTGVAIIPNIQAMTKEDNQYINEYGILKDDSKQKENFLNSLYIEGKTIKVKESEINRELFKNDYFYNLLISFTIPSNDLDNVKKVLSDGVVYVEGVTVYVKWWQAPLGTFSMDWTDQFVNSLNILTFPGLMTAALAKYVVLLPYIPALTTSMFTVGIPMLNKADQGRGVHVKVKGGLVTNITSL